MVGKPSGRWRSLTCDDEAEQREGKGSKRKLKTKEFSCLPREHRLVRLVRLAHLDRPGTAAGRAVLNH